MSPSSSIPAAKWTLVGVFLLILAAWLAPTKVPTWTASVLALSAAAWIAAAGQGAAVTRPTERLLREAFDRGFVGAVLGSVVLSTWLQLGGDSIIWGERSSSVAAGFGMRPSLDHTILFGALLGLCWAPLTVCEFVLGPRRGVWLAISLGVGTLGVMAWSNWAEAQADYVLTLAREDDFEPALQRVVDQLRLARRQPLQLGVLGLPFLLPALARLQGLTLWERLAVGAAPTAAISVVIAYSSHGVRGAPAPGVILLAMTALALMCVLLDSAAVTVLREPSAEAPPP